LIIFRCRRVEGRRFCDALHGSAWALAHRDRLDGDPVLSRRITRFRMISWAGQTQLRYPSRFHKRRHKIQVSRLLMDQHIDVSAARCDHSRSANLI
jgi:hypothetical protein